MVKIKSYKYINFRKEFMEVKIILLGFGTVLENNSISPNSFQIYQI